MSPAKVLDAAGGPAAPWVRSYSVRRATAEVLPCWPRSSSKLSFSAAYHFHHASARGELLRRLDHAAIFVMIAGTYTPFTVGILNGAAALWSTGSMWAAALAGAAVKWAYPRRFEWISIVCYLAMGWAAVIFMRPLLAALDRPTLTLIVIGGVVYSIGAGIHSWRRLPFHDAIWHALVLIAAGCHYAAILYGVVLLAPRS